MADSLSPPPPIVPRSPVGRPSVCLVDVGFVLNSILQLAFVSLLSILPLLSALLLSWVGITTARSDPHALCPILAIYALGRHNLWQPGRRPGAWGILSLYSHLRGFTLSSLWLPFQVFDFLIKLKIIIIGCAKFVFHLIQYIIHKFLIFLINLVEGISQNL